MSFNQWPCMLGFVFAAVAINVSSFAAAETVKLDCPSGTRQASSTRGKAPDIVACVKLDAKGFSPHGPTVYFYPNGVKEAEGMSEDGFRTGSWTFFSKEGRKTGTANFKRSNFHGDVVEFHENGKVKKVDHYVDGLREGVAREYSADGTLVKQAEYRGNREVSVK
jgi:hypothetical protein